MKNQHPEWVLCHKEKGYEIKKIQDKYYLYSVSSYYDKSKKRTIKKSGAFIGRITETGIQTKGSLVRDIVPRKVSVKEAGASLYLLSILSEEQKQLEQHFAAHWKSILICAIFRLLYQSSFKQMVWHYESSYLSEMYPNLPLGGKQISHWLKDIGQNRSALVLVMQGLQGGEELIIVDNTHIKTNSRLNLSAQLGYNSQRQFEPQINLLYLFSQDKQIPVFYRCVQGSIREVRALKLTVQESGLNSAVLVADKGFYSATNIAVLDQEKWQYVLPLPRRNGLIDYRITQTGNQRDFDGFFLYEKRPIWYKVTPIENEENKRTILFLDQSLKLQETNDYLTRITQEKEGYDLEQYHEKQKRFGTITLLTNTTQPKENHIPTTKAKNVKKEDPNATKIVEVEQLHPKKVFEYLKSRNDIEQLNDTYKNVLEADRTYMQSEETMEAWHFINFLAIRAYYRLFATLADKKLTSKLSPKYALLLLQAKKKVKINELWVDAEVPKKTQDLIKNIFNQNAKMPKPVT